LLDHYGYYKMPAELKEKVPEYMTADYAGVFYRVLYKVLSTSKDQVKPVNKPNDFSYFYNPGIKQVPERQEQSVLLVSMYIVYQLLEEAYNLSLEKSNVIPTSMLIKLGVMLGNKNEHYKSLQILRLAAERTDFPLDEAMLKALYPLAFKKEIISAATDNKIAEPLFFGLIRAESLFNSEIASWAGAQGLSQLMPATADEVAKRLSLDEYDIHDPQTNLDIGGWYLANVRNRNHDFSRALYAYNAGPSRVDSWNDDIGNYPSLLYLESIPIESTRKYVKRIFVSAQLYNILYFEYDSRHLAELFFSGIGDFIIKQKEAQ
jgi:soluble lytic murein transglycosylase